MKKFSLAVLTFINIINLLSLLMFIPGAQDRLLFVIDGAMLTNNILLNQCVVTITSGIIIGLYADIHKVQRPNTGFAIIKESTKTAKVLTGLCLIACVCACIKLHLAVFQYAFVCILHALCILNSSRAIAKLKL